MRNILSSAHVHTTFCDGKTTAQVMALDALRDLIETGALLEVNTGGVARGYY